MEIKTLQLNEFPAIFKRIKRDFAPGEYAPYFILRMQLKKGVQKGMLFIADNKPAAYAICAEGQNHDFVLLSLFAVFEEYRGYGYGSLFLKEIQKHYESKQGILAEVEKPENAPTPQEKAIQQKRIEFYKKALFRLVPDIDYSIWDVPMHLMVYSKKPVSSREVGEIIYDVYFKLMGKQFIHKMNFRAF